MAAIQPQPADQQYWKWIFVRGGFAHSPLREFRASHGTLPTHSLDQSREQSPAPQYIFALGRMTAFHPAGPLERWQCDDVPIDSKLFGRHPEGQADKLWQV